MPQRNSQKGQLLILAIMLIVIVGSFFLAGGLKYKKFEPKDINANASNFCCDSGDGDACKPSTTKKFTWKGTNAQPEEYGLIKSKIQLVEGSGHLAQAPTPDDKTPDGKPIFMNTTDLGASASYCSGGAAGNITGPGGVDSVGGGGCLPNDEIIYVCTNCGSDPAAEGNGGEFDAYYRISDGDVPDTIKNCSKNPVPYSGTGVGGLTVNEFVSEKEDNLQLQTLTFTSPGASLWLSPWCKPAVYLYPENNSLVSVKVKSSQPLTYTDPLYPAGGWNVLADKNGIITYQSKPIDYLYYETRVDDEILSKPERGYVVDKNQLKPLFAKILPKLGLNIRETQQFSDYWTHALPNSPYYFIGIVPQEELYDYSTLDINPLPTTEIRVSLYFETFNEKKEVIEPIIKTPTRSGFTVVEWGGIFKKHKGEKFSCFM